MLVRLPAEKELSETSGQNDEGYGKFTEGRKRAGGSSGKQVFFIIFHSLSCLLWIEILKEN